MENKGPIIALVDDDKIFQLTASKTLMSIQAANKVLQFENGEDALVYLRQNSGSSESLPDFIFLDINMPMVDGWMFLDDFSILKDHLAKPVKIFMVSSSIDPRDMTRAKSHGAVSDYIVKPVTREKFREILVPN
jgi:two-component system, chemotaxis family, chemotaxis protein CheY